MTVKHQKKKNKEGKQKTKFDSINPGTQIFFFITFNMTCYEWYIIKIVPIIISIKITLFQSQPII